MRPKSMEPVIEYFFGTGDGELSTWHSPADLDLNGDGMPDAVALDFDGDGLLDDAMWDSDGDGVADRVVLNVGSPAVSAYEDAGKGLWDVQSDAPAPAPTHGGPPEGDGRAVARLEVDDDGDGRPDQILEDTDGDGYADRVRRLG